ncbi:MAG: guanylate kinase [Synergistaceae bacterium]|nr:guanylate kinase [Synergistaceae bacterium]
MTGDFPIMTEGKRRGRLFVLSGPSGVGKGTLRERALDDLEDLVYSISCTTRAPRAGERDGVEYRFISKPDFEDRIKRGLFLEHAAVHDAYYGTLREDVERELNAGRDVLLEIDVQGAFQVRAALPDAVLLFVAPPSLEELERRLRERGTESDEKIRLRLRNAARELEQQEKYDRVVVNDDLDRASAELRGIILDYREKEHGVRE